MIEITDLEKDKKISYYFTIIILFYYFTIIILNVFSELILGDQKSALYRSNDRANKIFEILLWNLFWKTKKILYSSNNVINNILSYL